MLTIRYNYSGTSKNARTCDYCNGLIPAGESFIWSHDGREENASLDIFHITCYPKSVTEDHLIMNEPTRGKRRTP